MLTVHIDLLQEYPLKNLSDAIMELKKTSTRLSDVLSSDAGRELLGSRAEYPSKLRWIKVPGVPLITSAIAVCIGAGISVEVYLGETHLLATIAGEDHEIPSSIYLRGIVMSRLAAKN